MHVNTNKIEGVWSLLRGKLHAAHGYPAHHLPLVFAEVMYRSLGKSVWDLFRVKQ